MRVVGVDPGLNGALALLDGPHELSVIDMPTLTVKGRRRVDGLGLRSFVIDTGPVDLYVVERVTATATLGRAAAFSFGMGVGALLQVLIDFQRPTLTVPPKTWLLSFALDHDKASHRATARSLWPEHAELFQRSKDDGRADAALLAFWATRMGVVR